MQPPGRIHFLDDRQSLNPAHNLRSHAAKPPPNIEYFNEIGHQLSLADTDWPTASDCKEPFVAAAGM